jgi:hypothetical protein
MINTDIAWLAGLIEGEGCFSRSKRGVPEIEIAMTDEDVIRRAAILMNSSVQKKHPPSWRTRNWSPQWRTRAYGNNAIEIMKLVRPHMGRRRTTKIDSFVEHG